MHTEHATDPIIGRVLDGRYRVGPRIARGGMATVYEATDLRLDRTVAIKVMHAGMAEDDAFVTRFEREARSAARLAHHNVVAVFDQGEDAGTLFLVMEHVPGLTLRDLIRKEAPLSPARALSILEPILSALGAAHRTGMIHRDVKPENVLLADNGEVKVADFGLARAVNAETQHTATGGVLIGTVSYLSPELVVDGRADARADVYAAGVLLYEMLTGRKPHQADSPIQVAYKHVHEDVPPPSAVVPRLPAYVDALVARATARDTSLRPADAGVLLHQVRRVRHALDHGVADDAELTADLTPSTGHAAAPGVEGTDELPDIIDPSAAGAATEIVQLHRGGDGSGGSDGDDTGFDAAYAAGLTRSLAAPGDRLPAPRPPAGPPVRPVTAGPGRPPPRGGGRGPLLLAAALVLALLVGGGAWYFGVARYTVTPGVLNLSRSAAQAKVAKAGLAFQVAGHAWSETVVRGAVMDTEPDPGSRILKDGTVQVVISRGPERHAVPDVRGMTLDQAQQAILDRHLSYGRDVPRYSGKVPQGTVIRTSPKIGSEQRRNTAIDVVVSRGPRPIEIPDFQGKSLKKAEHALEKLGFTVDADVRQYSEDVPAGHVISQSPDSGTGHRGDTISLVVSRGPELVTVPDLVRQSADEAQQTLERMGLQVERNELPFYIGLNRVAHMSPSPGTQVPKGSTVTLDLV